MIDLHRVFGLDLTDDLLDSRTWAWLRARCYALLDTPDTLTLKEAMARGV